MSKFRDGGGVEVETKTGLSLRTILSYGVGHVLNDLCATMWFTYLLVFLQKIVKFSDFEAGILLMIGQVADAIATPIVGIESDRIGNSKYGRRKIWHLGGSIAVALSFPFIFNLCAFNCALAPKWSLFFYYAPFIVIFQFGWASTQISHLALIPDLATSKREKVTLNALRYGFTVGSNTFVYVVCWLLFETDNSAPGNLSSGDADKFKYLVLIVVGVGLVFASIFHLGVKETSEDRNISYKKIHKTENGLALIRSSSCRVRVKSCWTSWFREVQFYQIGGLYMATRLVVNISLVYIPMYLTDSLILEKKTIAIVPLIVFISGIMATAFARPFSGRFGLKLTYLVGAICVLAVSIWFWLLVGSSNEIKYSVYANAVLLGFGSSTLLIAVLAMTADLIGDNTQTGAFVYGAMSFLDKMSNGIVVLIIQRLFPCERAAPGCPTCMVFYRNVMALVPGGSAVLGLIVLISLSSTRIGVLADKRPHIVANGSIIKYGSIEENAIDDDDFLEDEKEPVILDHSVQFSVIKTGVPVNTTF